MASVALASDDRYDLPLEDCIKKNLNNRSFKGFPK